MFRSLFCLVLLTITALKAADNTSIKISSNVPVFYQLNIQGNARSDGQNPQINFKEYNIDIEFAVLIKQENETFAELVITPKKAQGALTFNHGTANFDFANEKELPFTSILLESFPILSHVHLNKPIRIAITNDEDFLTKPQSNYAYLPLKDPSHYANISSKILDLVMKGVELTARTRERTAIPELGLEIFHNKKVLNNYLRGDYTFRLFKALPSPVNCKNTLIGGGKLKNSAQMTNLLNNKAEGVFLIILQKANCVNKALDVRYEFRGKIRLQPKNSLISYSI